MLVCLRELVKDKIGAVKVFLELTLRVFDSISIGVTNGTLPYTCTLCVHLSASVHACCILAGGRRRGLHVRIIVKFVPPRFVDRNCRFEFVHFYSLIPVS